MDSGLRIDTPVVVGSNYYARGHRPLFVRRFDSVWGYQFQLRLIRVVSNMMRGEEEASQLAHNQEVAGSNPVIPIYGSVAKWLRRQIATLSILGSIPSGTSFHGT